MKNKKLLLLVFDLVLLSLLLAACGGAAAPTTNPTVAPTATQTAAPATPTPKPTVTGPGGFPVGTFKPDHLLWTHYILFNARGHLRGHGWVRGYRLLCREWRSNRVQ